MSGEGKGHRCIHCKNVCNGGTRKIATLEKELEEWKRDYKTLRAAINQHMNDHGYPNTLNASKFDNKLWSVLDRA